MRTTSLIKRKLWQKVVQATKHKKIYFFLYKSYWYHLIHKKTNTNPKNTIYFTAKPNEGAGIGHQMANWIAGFWFAKYFNLDFAHIPFSSSSWETFLGFGEHETTVTDLVENKGYKKVKLPLFDEHQIVQLSTIKRIINAYVGKRVVLVAEQDQFYEQQIGVIDDLQHKFYNATARINDNVVYDKKYCNVAIHVRRGDIVVWKTQRQSSNVERWQSNDYFVNTLNNVLQQMDTEKQIKIYLFSQGKESDFPEFKKFDNIIYCLDMSAQDSFLHMVFADVLITSKSSFSYKPALLNKGLKIVPPDFWHGYPKTKDWVVASKDGDVVIN
ncbi:hypothetical protein ACKGJY_06700 [Hyunsoonleella sp. 2307UL5-6]|uniref:hypothetical protein n=1 Tax=Hyunsoonleella sp. 2307UL5-6 TaxID=3384768 RepID=UPI0039BD2FBE